MSAGRAIRAVLSSYALRGAIGFGAAFLSQLSEEFFPPALDGTVLRSVLLLLASAIGYSFAGLLLQRGKPFRRMITAALVFGVACALGSFFLYSLVQNFDIHLMNMSRARHSTETLLHSAAWRMSVVALLLTPAATVAISAPLLRYGNLPRCRGWHLALGALVSFLVGTAVGEFVRLVFLGGLWMAQGYVADFVIRYLVGGALLGGMLDWFERKGVALRRPTPRDGVGVSE